MAANLRSIYVLDGSRAVSKAVRHVFGEKAEIQSCQVHRLRNVLEGPSRLLKATTYDDPAAPSLLSPRFRA